MFSDISRVRSNQGIPSMFKIWISDYLNMLNPKYFMLYEMHVVYINIYTKLPQNVGALQYTSISGGSVILCIYLAMLGRTCE